MKIIFAALGFLFLVLGLLGGLFSATMKTTVVGEGGQEVNNIGLIATKEAETTLSAGLAIVGAVLLGAVSVIEAIQVLGRQAGELAEKESKQQETVRRLLEAIAVNTQTQAAPVRAAVARSDDKFDAAIAADLRGPKKRP